MNSMNVSRETISMIDYVCACLNSHFALEVHESCVYADIGKDGGVIYRRMFNHKTGKAMCAIAADMILRGEY